MKSYKVLLLERANIRCAMWAMGLLTEEQLDLRLENIGNVAETIEQKREHVYLISTSELFNPFPLHSSKIPEMFRHLEKSNQILIEEHFPNEIL